MLKEERLRKHLVLSVVFAFALSICSCDRFREVSFIVSKFECGNNRFRLVNYSSFPMQSSVRLEFSRGEEKWRELYHHEVEVQPTKVNWSCDIVPDKLCVLYFSPAERPFAVAFELDKLKRTSFSDCRNGMEQMVKAIGHYSDKEVQLIVESARDPD